MKRENVIGRANVEDTPELKAYYASLEGEALGALWDHGPGTVRQLLELIEGRGRRWAYSTVATLLRRLESKGYATSESVNGSLVYRAAVSREDLLDINLKSAVWTAQAAGALMVPAGYGRIVFLSSVSGLLAHADHAPYAATKGGVNQLCRVMAREWAASGVTVNAVAPGYTETELTRAHLDKAGVRAGLTTLVPAGRLGTVADLAGPVLFLCSAQSAFVTGHVMYVDGGRTLV